VGEEPPLILNDPVWSLGKIVSRPLRPLLNLFRFRERGWGSCQVGIPDIGPAFPLPIGLFFPDLNVFALVAGVVHGEFIGAANETKIPGFGNFTLVAFQLITRPGLARRSPQSFLIASLVVAIGAFGGKTMASLE
jgi:hypothetical protein